ncbi:MAG: hypothetical protein ACR2JV_06585 [Gaiellales bacterium]
MSLLVVGHDGPVARALHDGAPAGPDAVAETLPEALAIVALPASAGSIGALDTSAFAELADATVTMAIAAATQAAALGTPVRIALLCPADGLHPDHLDGARSVVAAGLTMLTEVAAALPGITMNTIAVADDVPAAEVAEVARLALSGVATSLNGATIRLDGGRDAVLAAETRAEGA